MKPVISNKSEMTPAGNTQAGAKECEPCDCWFLPTLRAYDSCSPFHHIPSFRSPSPFPTDINQLFQDVIVSWEHLHLAHLSVKSLQRMSSFKDMVSGSCLYCLVLLLSILNIVTGIGIEESC